MTTPADTAQPNTAAAAPAPTCSIVSDTALIAMGMAHLNRGARNIEAARETAQVLRKEYQKVAKRHRNVKLTALAAESLLMAFYGYGAVEHYTGYKDSISAVAVNSGISGGISVTRAAVQYGLMKRGEEAFREGDKTRGLTFTAMGLSLAAINSVFVAVGFANKFIVQEQGMAMTELEKLSADEARVHAAKTEAAAQLNAQMEALDRRIADIQSGASDPRLTTIQTEINRLSGEIDAIRDDPKFNDGQNTEWDVTARRDMNVKDGQISDLRAQQQDIMRNAGSTLTAEQQAAMQATSQQRLDLNTQLQALDARFQPQLDALRLSRQLWESKLGGAAAAGNSSWAALTSNPTILVEALANVAAISVANWWAATEGYKEEQVQHILAGTGQDPWASNGTPANSNGQNQLFLGYNTAAAPVDHLRNETRLNALSQTLGNTEAMRSELKMEVTNQYSQMIELLNASRATMSAEEYKERLEGINGAYNRAAKLMQGDAILQEIGQVMANVPGRSTLAVDAGLPVFEDPTDPRFKVLPKGATFKTADGQVKVKR